MSHSIRLDALWKILKAHQPCGIDSIPVGAKLPALLASGVVVRPASPSGPPHPAFSADVAFALNAEQGLEFALATMSWNVDMHKEVEAGLVGPRETRSQIDSHCGRGQRRPIPRHVISQVPVRPSTQHLICRRPMFASLVNYTRQAQLTVILGYSSSWC
eukprot:1347228-Amphidinium_carterae.2